MYIIIGSCQGILGPEEELGCVSLKNADTIHRHKLENREFNASDVSYTLRYRASAEVLAPVPDNKA